MEKAFLYHGLFMIATLCQGPFACTSGYGLVFYQGLCYQKEKKIFIDEALYKPLKIRPSKIEDAGILTSLSFESKKYWGYPDHFFETWKKELFISPDYIRQNRVFVAKDKGRILGYYSLVHLENDIDASGILLLKGHWLEHMFILPDFIGKGIGKTLFHHLKIICREHGISRVSILSDPNAREFYEKMGCQYIKEIASTIPNRTTPLLILTLWPE